MIDSILMKQYLETQHIDEEWVEHAVVLASHFEVLREDIEEEIEREKKAKRMVEISWFDGEHRQATPEERAKGERILRFWFELTEHVNFTHELECAKAESDQSR